MTQNQYLYAEGNPVGNMDPSGHVTKSSSGNKKISQTGKIPTPSPAPLQKSSTKKDEKKKAPAPIVTPPAPQKKNTGSKTTGQRTVEAGGSDNALANVVYKAIEFVEGKAVVEETVLPPVVQEIVQTSKILNRQFCSGDLKNASSGAGRAPTSEGELRAIAQQAFLLSLDAGTVREWMSFSEFLYILIMAIITFIAPYIIPILLIAAGIISIIYGIYLAWQDAQTSAAEGTAEGTTEGQDAAEAPASPKQLSRKRANKVARESGYSGAEELKEDYVSGRGNEYEMYRDTSDGRIWLRNHNNGSWIPTYVFYPELEDDLELDTNL